jgi:hypothetical protein
MTNPSSSASSVKRIADAIRGIVFVDLDDFYRFLVIGFS